LIEEAQTRALVEGHTLLGDVFQWQRLTIEGSFEAASVPPAILRRVANAVGRPDAATLLADLRETQAAVRDVFDKVLGQDAS
jgi:glutamate-ammonia-ligase adenylyltransferase